MENKKIIKLIKKIYQKEQESIIKIFLKIRKSKNKVIRNKTMSDGNRKSKKEYIKNITMREKNLLNHLIICVE